VRTSLDDHLSYLTCWLICFQAIPRKVWLDPSGRQLMQWPVEEVEALRGKKPVTLKDRVVKRGQHVEITGLQTAQVSP
jgi:beta-fructofuranosidase